MFFKCAEKISAIGPFVHYFDVFAIGHDDDPFGLNIVAVEIGKKCFFAYEKQFFYMVYGNNFFLTEG